jgi:hypothetical protein
VSSPDRAPVLRELVVGDTPEAWAAAGFAVDPSGSVQVGDVTVRLVGRADGHKRILSWSFAGLGPVEGGSLDGLATSAVDGAAVPAPDAPHGNGVVGLDHVVIASPDDQRTVAALEAAGFSTRRTRETDTYGAPMRQTFFRSGEVILELIGATEPSGDGPAGFFGLAWTVADLDALVDLLGPALGTPKEAVQPGRRIATLRHKELGMSVATAFMSPEPR